MKKLFIGGQWVDTGTYMDVLNPYDGSVVDTICTASAELTKQAIDAAFEARDTMKHLPAARRGKILDNMAALIERDKEEIAALLCAEAGKGIMFARGEAGRTGENFKFAADEARRLSGELVPYDASESGTNRFGYFKRYPIGVIGAITPFNFPLNLVAHKVGPAIAAGCPIVLKPASTTPLTAHKVTELLLEAGLPACGINLVVGSGSVVGNTMVESDRIAMITFTGSPSVGLDIKAKAGIKKVTLELGSNSAAIVHEDADIRYAVPKCVIGAFANSGQVCISIQRIYIHESRYDEFRNMFVDAVKASRNGDPKDEKTLVGPMIEEREAIRAEGWIKEAVSQGAVVAVGGNRKGTLLEATVLENTNEQMTIVREEVFGPVVCIMKYKTLDEVIERVNDSQFGLQAGIFTDNIQNAFKAIDRLEVGGVMINDMPTFRVDQMPYGGVKLSGTGREGPRFAVEEMTELKTVMFNLN
ncbi:aldehyde dehydrogenase family protein [Seleniivibrio sp.]|uniref:aldehyde dehydrogenase family protein n=1 Tax=Seleniivibrio sp. TaxID=2898801 RepID=UPI0025CE2E55|nr:aldehyde dehydrogenase family protein [Seleniivibrio sp.]MCD8553790.1 aldehyde dehydrogenase family protein [Seleniivibrio sp.]